MSNIQKEKHSDISETFPIYIKESRTHSAILPHSKMKPCHTVKWSQENPHLDFLLFLQVSLHIRKHPLNNNCTISNFHLHWQNNMNALVTAKYWSLLHNAHHKYIVECQVHIYSQSRPFMFKTVFELSWYQLGWSLKATWGMKGQNLGGIRRCT